MKSRGHLLSGPRVRGPKMPEKNYKVGSGTDPTSKLEPMDGKWESEAS